MDEDKLRQLKKLAEEATPGPWEVGEELSQVVSPCECCGLIATCAQFGTGEHPSCYNSEYIAAVNPETVLELLAEIDRLRTISAAQTELIDWYESDHDRANCEDADVDDDLREAEQALKAAEAKA